MNCWEPGCPSSLTGCAPYGTQLDYKLAVRAFNCLELYAEPLNRGVTVPHVWCLTVSEDKAEPVLLLPSLPC